ncbi:hypothetical protein BN1723_007422, partial [Verticillium longisporum]|uniref:Uncharacterized protein n=2 Tax=Verticillium TaxID=1036719 RepID=A0AA44WAQ2_VERDA
MSSNIPEFLYHSVLTIVEHDPQPNGQTSVVHILGTHGTIPAAKAFATRALAMLGYDKNKFQIYQTRPAQVATGDASEWKHGDGIIIYAKAPAGQEELFVGINTTHNSEWLPASPEGNIVLPGGLDHLHYVSKTTIDYNFDRIFNTEVQGAYVERAESLTVAKSCLESNIILSKDFAQYDSRDDLGPEANWPFGDKVLVHAVANTGEGIYVSVKVPPHACLTHQNKDYM